LPGAQPPPCHYSSKIPLPEIDRVNGADVELSKYFCVEDDQGNTLVLTTCPVNPKGGGPGASPCGPYTMFHPGPQT
jgi:hypothetical protein